MLTRSSGSPSSDPAEDTLLGLLRGAPRNRMSERCQWAPWQAVLCKPESQEAGCSPPAEGASAQQAGKRRKGSAGWGQWGCRDLTPTPEGQAIARPMPRGHSWTSPGKVPTLWLPGGRVCGEMTTQTLVHGVHPSLSPLGRLRGC